LTKKLLILFYFLAFTSFQKKLSGTDLVYASSQNKSAKKYQASLQQKVTAPQPMMNIHIKLQFEGLPIHLNEKYPNQYERDTFSISKFRFYLGRLSAIYPDSTKNKKNVSGYYLIDLSDSSSLHIRLPVSAGSCKGLEFQIGIDSLDQLQGAQTGVLDPIRGMFWTWNSGYTNLKMEGASSASAEPAHQFAYHIGGTRDPYNTVFKLDMITTDHILTQISKGQEVNMELRFELALFFQKLEPLHLSEHPVCTTPGDQAKNISWAFLYSFRDFGTDIHP